MNPTMTEWNDHYNFETAGTSYTIAPITRQVYAVYSGANGEELFPVYKFRGGWYIRRYQDATADLLSVVLSELVKRGYSA